MCLLCCVGLEIREALAQRAEEQRKASNVKNVIFMFFNAMVVPHFSDLLTSLQEYSEIQAVSFNFPDPWFKRKHHKRRILQPDVVESLKGYVPVWSGTVDCLRCIAMCFVSLVGLGIVVCWVFAAFQANTAIVT